MHAQKQQLLQELMHAGVRDKQILAAIGRVPREKFVDTVYISKAYDNIALQRTFFGVSTSVLGECIFVLLVSETEYDRA